MDFCLSEEHMLQGHTPDTFNIAQMRQFLRGGNSGCFEQTAQGRQST